jgi:hypothetical protein
MAAPSVPAELAWSSAHAEDLVAEVQALYERLRPRFPEMDPGDLKLILECMLRPWGTGRGFFLRQIRPGVYVP